MRPVAARWIALAVAAAATLVQLPALAGPLLWDDVLLLERTDLYTSAARWHEAVTTPLGGETFYWRPLATTTFLLESCLHGGAAAGYRLTAALLHGAAAACAFGLLRRLLASNGAAAAGALLWAMLPAHVETATWVSARFDVLAALFAFLALLSLGADGAPRSLGARAGVAAATFAACLSKESGFVVPAAAALWATALAGRWDLRRATTAFAWSAAGAAAAVFLRYETLGYVLRARPATAAQAGGALEHAFLVGRAAATYFGALFGGVGPAHAGPRPVPVGDLLGSSGLALLAATAALAVFALRRFPRRGFLLVAALAALLPVLQVVPLDLSGGLDAADRFLYLPSFFVVAALADVGAADARAQPAARRSAARVAAAAIVVALCVRSYALWQWNDPVRFWRWAADMAPKSDVVRANLAYALLEAGETADAAENARAAGDAGVEQLADALEALGRTRDALAALDEALARRAGHARWSAMRGRLRALGGAADLARSDLETAERRADSFDWATWTRIAWGWDAAGEPARADAARRRAAGGGAVGPPREDGPGPGGGSPGGGR